MASAKPSSPRTNTLLILGAMLGFGLMALFTRQAKADIMAISAWRAVFVAVVFGGWAMVQEGGPRALVPDRTTMRLGGLLGLALAVASSTFVGGYALTTVANTIFLHNLAPVVVFPLAWWWFRERPSSAALTGAAIALAGVALLSGVSLFNVGHYANPRFLMGDLLSVASALGYGAVLVLIRATRRAGTPILGTLWVGWVVAAVVLVLVALAMGSLSLPMGAVIWVLLLAVVSTNIPFWLLNLGMRGVGAGTAAVLSLAEVLFATLVGLLFFGEVLSPIGWLGGALAALGVLYAMAAESGVVIASSQVAPLSGRTRTPRLGRLGLALVLLNAGALLTFSSGTGGGAVLAWIALLMLARLGLVPAIHALDGAFARTLGWISTGLAGAVLLGLAYRGGYSDPGADGLLVVLALGACLVDRALAAQEAPAERDPGGLVQGALLCLAGGQLFGRFDHPGVQLLAVAAAVLVALGAARLLLAGIARQVPAVHPHEATALGFVERLPEWFARPTRLVGALFLVWALGGVHIIQAGERGIVERVGAPLADPLEPGLSLRLPPPIEQVRIVQVAAVRRIPVVDPGSPVLCGDHAMVALNASLQFTVSDPLLYAFTAQEPDLVLADLARSAVASEVGHRPQDAVLTTGREELQAAIAQATQAAADEAGLGVRVTDVYVASVAVPGPVLASFLDVISAAEERQMSINQAEAYAADLVPRTSGAAIELMSAAKGEAAMQSARADGWVARFDALRIGGAAAPGLTRERLRLEQVEDQLGPPALVVVSPHLGVWLGEPPETDPSTDVSNGSNP